MLATLGISPLTESLNSVGAAVSLIERKSPVFSLAYIPQPAPPDLVLSSTLPIRNVAFPPLIAVVDGEPDVDIRERLRLAGAVHVTSYPLSPQRDKDVVEIVKRFPAWFSTPADQMNVQAVVQLMAAHRLSGMISVECGCVSAVSEFSWRRAGPFRCVQKAEVCSGFQGRVYVREGEVIHAESPAEVGSAAYMQMCALKEGMIRVHEVFVEPRQLIVPTLDSNSKKAKRRAMPPPIPGRRKKVSVINRSKLSGGGSGGANAIPSSAQVASQAVANSDESSLLSVSAMSAQVAGQKTRQTMKAGMNTLLKVAPNLKVAAKSDSGGNAIEVAGDGDGESVCAVTAMCASPVSRLGELLGLGSPESWSVVTDKVALYVQQDGDSFVSVLGNSNKNPDQILTKLAKAYQNPAGK